MFVFIFCFSNSAYCLGRRRVNKISSPIFKPKVAFFWKFLCLESPFSNAGWKRIERRNFKNVRNIRNQRCSNSDNRFCLIEGWLIADFGPILPITKKFKKCLLNRLRLTLNRRIIGIDLSSLFEHRWEGKKIKYLYLAYRILYKHVAYCNYIICVYYIVIHNHTVK